SAACSSSVSTRPSQNCVLLWSAFNTVGALRWPTRPWMPIDTGLPSVKARSGSWQVAQATVPSLERRGSEKNVLPHAKLESVRVARGMKYSLTNRGETAAVGDSAAHEGPP